ncbi:hypothetical protein Syun_005098 [Stephania yunnanensis]|uniref:Uncharacterized protein n=1 Tax=Stephania yunnanensis TaxID=152371 RepID=A0AAP0L4H6_9MAGN
MIDLPGLTKVAVGKFYCFAIVGMLKSGSSYPINIESTFVFIVAVLSLTD